MGTGKEGNGGFTKRLGRFAMPVGHGRGATYMVVFPNPILCEIVVVLYGDRLAQWLGPLLGVLHFPCSHIDCP